MSNEALCERRLAIPFDDVRGENRIQRNERMVVFGVVVLKDRVEGRFSRDSTC
jgi:hypothetical protein